MLKHGNRFKGTKTYHFLCEVLLQALADSMYKTGHRGAHGHLRVIGHKQMDRRRVALPAGLCLES